MRSKAGIEINVAIEKAGSMRIELIIDEEACVEVTRIEVFENIVNEFRKEEVGHSRVAQRQWQTCGSEINESVSLDEKNWLACQQPI